VLPRTQNEVFKVGSTAKAHCGSWSARIPCSTKALPIFSRTLCYSMVVGKTGETHISPSSRGRVSQSGQTEPRESAINSATDQKSGAKNRKTEISLGEPAAVNLSGYRQTLGVCWLVYGIFRLIMGICLVLFGGKATVMFGALLGRVPNPFALMGDFHVIYAVIVVLTLLCGLFGFLAGLALLASQRLARTLALLAAFLSVSEIPFGTTLGIYTMIVLLPLRGVSPPIRS